MNFITDYYDYKFYNDRGHISVSRSDGSFAFSTDTVEEAKRETDADIFARRDEIAMVKIKFSKEDLDEQNV